MSLSSPQVIGENTKKGKFRNYYCEICCNNYGAASTLAIHLMSKKHKNKLKTIKPQEQIDAICLNSFMKAHMKEDPVVGLEYIIERKQDPAYEYSCQLCDLLVCPLPTILSHLMKSAHIKCYIKKHFPHLMPKFSACATKQDNVESLRAAAEAILELQGNKKQIQVVLPESDSNTREASKDTPPSKPESDGKIREASKDTPPSKPESDGKIREASEDTPPSKPESGTLSHLKLSLLPNQESRESYRYNKMLQKSNSSDPPLAKRSRTSPGGYQDDLPSTPQISKHGSSHYNKSHAVKMDCTATQKLEFKTNDEFFEYFANFVISDDEDVDFIRTITQNCIKALTRFQQEEIERRNASH